MRIIFVYLGGNLEYFGVHTFPTFTPLDYLNTGLGGTESFLVLLSKKLSERGHDVIVYAPCEDIINYFGVIWRPVTQLESMTADLVICVRTPETVEIAYTYIHTKSRWLWLHDWQIDAQKVQGLIQRKLISQIVVNSHTHYELIKSQVALSSDYLLLLSAGVNLEAYSRKLPKVSGRCIYCTMPGRGLKQLLQIWPYIKKQVSNAHLVITSGYELWKIPNNTIDRLMSVYAEQLQALDSVIYAGVLPKEELVVYQLTSEVFLYPSTFLEMCCISALECIAAETVLITRAHGALGERVISGVSGYLIEGDSNEPTFQRHFVDKATSVLLNHDLRKQMALNALALLDGHSYDDIAVGIESVLIAT